MAALPFHRRDNDAVVWWRWTEPRTAYSWVLGCRVTSGAPPCPAGSQPYACWPLPWAPSCRTPVAKPGPGWGSLQYLRMGQSKYSVLINSLDPWRCGSTVETLYSTIPYTTIFYITWWTHGPQNLQRPIRTLIVLLGFGIKQIFV